MSYMSAGDIRILSRRVPIIVDAPLEELQFWMDEAKDVIDTFCGQSFDFEHQTTKTVRATTSTLVYLPKPLSGEVTISGENNGVLFSTQKGTPINNNIPSVFIDLPIEVHSGNSTKIFELFPGSHVFGYYWNNQLYRSPAAKTLFVTGDWGYKLTELDLLISAANELKQTYAAHIASTVFHIAADTTNTVTVTATNETSAIDLANELQNAFNNHLASTTVHTTADTNASDVSIATDVSSAFLLLYDLKNKFNEHIDRGSNNNPPIHLEKDEVNISVVNLDDKNAVMPSVIRRSFLRIVQRIAIRSDYEDHRQISSPYITESLGDEYSYDLSNGTMRNLIRPEEAVMLLPYVNRGPVVM